MPPPAPPRFPLANHLEFAQFNNHFAAQTCYVIGRGPTLFNFESLTQLTQPIFFINDAVSLERYATSQSFFFAHDATMLPWLNGQIKSTAVIPVDGKIFRSTPRITLNHAADIVFYHWRENKTHQLLQLDRNQLAKTSELYTHTGTIHSVMHFIWYCGFTSVKFIGCDGLLGVNHDPRIANQSNSQPSDKYASIAHVQRLLCQLFNLQSEYLGTPTDLSPAHPAYNPTHGKEDPGTAEKF